MKRYISNCCHSKIDYMVAQSEYITFCDCDDYLSIDALEMLYKEAISFGTDIASGNLILVKANRK